MTFSWIRHSGRWLPRREMKSSLSVKSSRVLSILPFSTRFLGCTPGSILWSRMLWWSLITQACSVTHRPRVSEACRSVFVSPDPTRAASSCIFRESMRRTAAPTSAWLSNTIWIMRANGSRRPHRVLGQSCSLYMFQVGPGLFTSITWTFDLLDSFLVDNRGSVGNFWLWHLCLLHKVSMFVRRQVC